MLNLWNLNQLPPLFLLFYTDPFYCIHIITINTYKVVLLKVNIIKFVIEFFISE